MALKRRMLGHETLIFSQDERVFKDAPTKKQIAVKQGNKQHPTGLQEKVKYDLHWYGMTRDHYCGGTIECNTELGHAFKKLVANLETINEILKRR